MDDKLYEKITRYIYDHAGIQLGSNKKSLVMARMGKRMRSLNLQSYADYAALVLSGDDPAEVTHFFDVVSTNVTHFFREAAHFDIMSEVVKAWVKSGQQSFRIWCCASSSGEEPISIAISFLEAAENTNLDMKILATDISTRILSVANRGAYQEEKLAAVSKLFQQRYFSKEHTELGPSWVVKDLIKKRITYRRLNLAKPPFPMKGPMDIVFCRNVMIYFDDEVRSRLLAEIYRLLKPGGYLFVGHAEGLTGLKSNFKSRKPSVYMK